MNIPLPLAGGYKHTALAFICIILYANMEIGLQKYAV